MCTAATSPLAFEHLPLGISDRNKMVLWPGCEGRARVSFHTKNVRSVQFVVKRRGCCCNLSVGVALIVWFTANGMCAKNNISNNRVISSSDLYCCLLPVRSFAHMPLGLSDRNSTNYQHFMFHVCFFMYINCIHFNQKRFVCWSCAWTQWNMWQ